MFTTKLRLTNDRKSKEVSIFNKINHFIKTTVEEIRDECILYAITISNKGPGMIYGYVLYTF